MSNESAQHTLDSAADEMRAATSASLEKVNEMVGSYPVTAVLASAAAGAGLIALLALVGRSSAPGVSRSMDYASDLSSNLSKKASRTADGYASRVADDYSDLKTQLGDLAKRLTDALPSKREAGSAVDSVIGSATEKAADTWATVREQAQLAMNQIRPQIDATADVARAHPLWSALAVGALGALLGAQFLSRDSD
jgi:ElaB/YqjD/DUF883 family membrane-anchored ribosome-binding protein